MSGGRERYVDPVMAYRVPAAQLNDAAEGEAFHHAPHALWDDDRLTGSDSSQTGQMKVIEMCVRDEDKVNVGQL